MYINNARCQLVLILYIHQTIMISSYLRNKERYTTSKIISDIRQTEDIVVQEEAGFCSPTGCNNQAWLPVEGPASLVSIYLALNGKHGRCTLFLFLVIKWGIQCNWEIHTMHLGSYHTQGIEARSNRKEVGKDLHKILDNTDTRNILLLPLEWCNNK